jgi:hypothetical protein
MNKLKEILSTIVACTEYGKLMLLLHFATVCFSTDSRILPTFLDARLLPGLNACPLYFDV